MAKFSEFPTDAIYQAATEFFELCMNGDGSLVQGETAKIWTSDSLQAFKRTVIDQPLISGRGGDGGADKLSFSEKLDKQLISAPQNLRQLTAELLAVYFLFTSGTGQRCKVDTVNKVLGQHDGRKLLASFSTAFANGVGDPGMLYNIKRPAQLAFIADVAIRWKALPTEERAKARESAWSFMDFVDGVDGADGVPMRHVLLHLIYPDQFERIASAQHKREIAKAFASLITDHKEQNLDKRLYEIRGRLKQLDLVLEYAGEMDFYWSPLAQVWYDGGEAGEGEGAALDGLRHKRQIILFGPPGTSKTYGAKQIADRIIRAALLRKLGPKEYFERGESQISAEVKGRVRHLQLHPAYGYEDFIRGLHLGEGGKTEYRDGYLLKLTKEMEEESEPQDGEPIPYVLILDEINRTDLSRMLGESFSLLENRGESIDLPAYDAGGRVRKLCIPKHLYLIGTMNLIDQSVEQLDFALRRRFLWFDRRFEASTLLAAVKAMWGNEKSRHGWDAVQEDFKGLARAAQALNSTITASPSLGSDYEIGHAFFLDAVAFLKEDLRSRTGAQIYLWNSKNEALWPVSHLWHTSLKPLLSQYLAGLDSKTKDSELRKLEQVFLKRPKEEV